MYQQDVLTVLDKMKKNNDEYDYGLKKIKELFITKIETV